MRANKDPPGLFKKKNPSYIKALLKYFFSLIPL